MVRGTKIMAETIEVGTERTINVINQEVEPLKEKENKIDKPQPKESKVRSKLIKIKGDKDDLIMDSEEIREVVRRTSYKQLYPGSEQAMRLNQ